MSATEIREQQIRCPQCGGELQIEPKCEITESYLPGNPIRGAELPRRTRIAPAALCNSCEFCIEIKADAGFRMVL